MCFFSSELRLFFSKNSAKMHLLKPKTMKEIGLVFYENLIGGLQDISLNLVVSYGWGFFFE